MLALNKEQVDQPIREWKAHLVLGFETRAGKTTLTERKHFGPLVVQRPFYPEGDVCHLYIIHPPGGVVGGDNLRLDVHMKESTQTLLTTPSAGKFYRMDGTRGYLTQQIVVENKSQLEWFPQENIFFDGSSSRTVTNIELNGEADFCGWEINCLGRPAANEKFLSGEIYQQLSIQRDGKPLFIERNYVTGNSELLSNRCGFNNASVFGTMLATSMGRYECSELQDKYHMKDEGSFSVTLINDLLVCRYLGDSAEEAKAFFIEAWHLVRQKQKNRAICKPRIWNT